MKEFLLQRIKVTCLIFLIFFLIVCVILPLTYLITGKMNFDKCLPQVADRLGVEPDIGAIYNYIENSVEPGMDRSDVIQAFETVGPVVIVDTKVWENLGSVHETLAIDMCSHPRNDIFLTAVYSLDLKLSHIRIDMFD